MDLRHDIGVLGEVFHGAVGSHEYGLCISENPDAGNRSHHGNAVGCRLGVTAGQPGISSRQNDAVRAGL